MKQIGSALLILVGAYLTFYAGLILFLGALFGSVSNVYSFAKALLFFLTFGGLILSESHGAKSAIAFVPLILFFAGVAISVKGVRMYRSRLRPIETTHTVVNESIATKPLLQLKEASVTSDASNSTPPQKDSWVRDFVIAIACLLFPLVLTGVVLYPLARANVTSPTVIQPIQELIKFTSYISFFLAFIFAISSAIKLLASVLSRNANPSR